MSVHSRLFHLEEIMSDPCFGCKGNLESLSAYPKIPSEYHFWSMNFLSCLKIKRKKQRQYLHIFCITIFAQNTSLILCLPFLHLGRYTNSCFFMKLWWWYILGFFSIILIEEINSHPLHFVFPIKIYIFKYVYTNEWNLFILLVVGLKSGSTMSPSNTKSAFNSYLLT